jgi:toxin ParE1/3/4
MIKYRLSNEAKEDLIRIHGYGVKRFGVQQADKYFKNFFEYFEIIANRPFAFESVDHIKKAYRRCDCCSESIYFKLDGNIMEIMAIVGKQDLHTFFLK